MILCFCLCDMLLLLFCFFFFFKQKTAYEMRISDWSSDVCSSDLSDPVEIGDFAALFSGMGAQFERYLAEQHPDLKGQAHMFVKEVRKGSIIADLIPSIPDLIGYMDNVLIVGGFGALFSARVRKLISGQDRKSDV